MPTSKNESDVRGRAVALFKPLSDYLVGGEMSPGDLRRALATRASRRLTNVLEPFLIFGLSGLVLVLALAVLLPMWNLIAVFKQH